ncbi:hypothetical protein V6N13_072313 [Hibiscus sabdariffa]
MPSVLRKFTPPVPWDLDPSTSDLARHFSYEGAPSCSCTAGLLFCLAACPTSLSWAQSKTLQLRASTDAFKLT